ncbi:MAG TPA: SLC13 family permease [Acetobacteraceae bacterium]|nr:SLC13 family permease [Acetobacteraceae bacterium]
MTLHQAEAFGIVGGMFVLFITDRLRYDLVAALALACAILTGVVPSGHAFRGFSNPLIIIIGSVLVLSRSVAISGVVDAAMRRVTHVLQATSSQVLVLTSAVTFLSAVMKNVGALGIFMPIAIQAAERNNRPPSRYLMPLSFGSLIGGTITLIGTSPNLLISTVRQETQGRPFHFFDFTPVGLPLSLLAIGFLCLGWRLLPERRGEPAPEKRFTVEDYTTEALLPEDSPLVGKTVGDLEALAEADVTVAAIIRDQDRRYIPSAHWTLFSGDLLLLQGDPVAVKPLVDQAGLKLIGSAAIADTARHGKDDELEAVEAVVSADSPLIGNTPRTLHLRQRFQVNLLALTRGDRRITTRLRESRFGIGDIVVLQGRRSQIGEALRELGCLPLAERNLTLGQTTPRWAALVILLAAIALVVSGVLAVEAAFFIAAVLVVLLRLISPRQAYDALDGPLLVMLACLIPVGEALSDTGAAKLVATGLTAIMSHMPASLAVGLLLVIAMIVTPFLHHAAAVLVIGPVAAALAHNLGVAPEAFLMAVALGASCDFLTPIGHQNNLLVMGPAGYRFGDYWRLGLPLSVMVAVVGTALIVLVWPLH